MPRCWSGKVGRSREEEGVAHIGLVACVGGKRPVAAPARDLYDSPLFTKTRAYVERHCDGWFVLSAKHGLARPDAVIAPYDETLNRKTIAERRQWAERVWAELRLILNPGDQVTILAGHRYREYLETPINQRIAGEAVVPMRGMGIGKQLQWLTERLAESPRIDGSESTDSSSRPPRPGRALSATASRPARARDDIERFYALAARLEEGLGGKLTLKQCEAGHIKPVSGVYLFFEPGEKRRHGKFPRVTRVGTQQVSRGSKATLWSRLRAHRGPDGGLGNHRGSVFRRHVGRAIIARDSLAGLESWEDKKPTDPAAEQALERLVSAYIGNLSFLYLAVEDPAGPDSDRAYLERNIIGLLAGTEAPLDPPSPDWLGRFSPEPGIQKSGLWNLDFLGRPYDHEFLDILEEYVLVTIGAQRPADGPLAPRNWHPNERRKKDRH